MSAIGKYNKRGCSGESSSASKAETIATEPECILGPPCQGDPWSEAFDLQIEYRSDRQPSVQRSFKFRVRATKLGILVVLSVATLIYAIVEHDPAFLQRAATIPKLLK